jgi:Protein of unknown function (DUF3102)
MQSSEQLIFDHQVARPLRVLVPLIKEDLEKGREAAERAGMPYYKAAGEKMVEAKQQISHGEFQRWIKDNFNLSKTTAHRYMSLAEATQKFPQGNFSSMKDFRRRYLGEDTRANGYVHQDSKRSAVALELAKNAEEREARYRLALQLIDVGYKTLAVKLHPDKEGGSQEAMTRLNHVRNGLKQYAAARL